MDKSRSAYTIKDTIRPKVSTKRSVCREAGGTARHLRQRITELINDVPQLAGAYRGADSRNQSQTRNLGYIARKQRPHSLATGDQYSSIMRCNAARSDVSVSPSISRILAFLGCKLSATM